MYVPTHGHTAVILNTKVLLCILLSYFLAVADARAHDVFLTEELPNGEVPNLLLLAGERADPVPLGAQLNLRVSDLGICAAEVTVTNNNSELTITPALVQFGVTVDFGIVPTQAGEFTIQVGWVGEHVGGEGNCQEYHLPGDSIRIVVIDPNDDSAANLPSAGDAGDPVNTFNGELFFNEQPDLDLGGPMSLHFSRYYASYLRRSFIVGELGDNWRHNFEWRIHWTGNLIRVVDPRGRFITYTSDGMGSWTQQDNLHVPYQLRQDNQEINLLDPSTGLKYNFNAYGRLAKIDDGKGNIHTLTYYEDYFYPQARKLRDVTNNQASTRKLVFNYTLVGSLVKLTNVSEVIGGLTKRNVSFAYDVNGDNMEQFINARGLFTTYDYVVPPVGADRAMMRYKQFPKGNYHYLQDYIGLESQTNSGKVETQTDADGNVQTFNYTSPTQTNITDPNMDTRFHSHTPGGALTNYQGQDGLSVAIGNDGTGRRNSVTDRLGDTVSYDYHPASGQVETITHADGSTTSFSFASRVDGDGFTFYDLVGITWPDGTEEAFVHDAFGNVTSHTDPAGNVATFTYNAFGQVLTRTNAAGGVSTRTYNAYGDLATSTDPAGNTTSYAYDDKLRLATTTYADATSRSYAYDDHNRLLTTTDERGNVTSLAYDNNDNIQSLTDAAGNGNVFGYDAMDRVVSAIDPRSNQTSFTYDALGRRESSTDPNGNVTTYSYDSRGNLVEAVDRGGMLWSWEYDDEGVVTVTTDPLGSAVDVASNQAGKAVSTTDALGNFIAVQRDNMERITSMLQRDGGVSLFSYDSLGQLTSTTLPGGGIVASYEYDVLGNITQVTDPNGNTWNANFDNQSRLLSTLDPLGNVIAYQFDARNRMTQANLPGSNTQVITRDDAGNVQAMNFSDGTSLNFTFDVLNRVTAAEGVALDYDANSNIVHSNGIDITHSVNNRVETMTLAAGKDITYTYNARDLVAQIYDWAGGITTFNYDDAGRVTTISRPNGITTTYVYDANNRITGISEGVISSIVLTRDANGHTASSTRNVPEPTVAPGAIGALGYDAASQVASFNYDELGRLLDDGDNTYSWDLASRLTEIDDGVDAITYGYDALGNRTSRTVGGVTTNYVVNYAIGLPSVSIQRQGATDDRYFVYTPGGELMYSISASDNSHRYYHYDETGNTQFITNDAGAITASYAYSPYGAIVSESGATDDPFTWQGQLGVMREPGGVYYMRARYYDSATGRFLSRDPVKSIQPRSINPYQYALGNPIRFVDPSGREVTADDVLDGVEVGLTCTAAIGVGFIVGMTAPISVVACEIVGAKAAVAAAAGTEAITAIGGLGGFLQARNHRARIRSDGRRQRYEMEQRAIARRRAEAERLADLKKQRDYHHKQEQADLSCDYTPNAVTQGDRGDQQTADRNSWTPGMTYDYTRDKPYDTGYTRGDEAAHIFSDAPHNYDIDDKYDGPDEWEIEADRRRDDRMLKLMNKKQSERKAQQEKADKVIRFVLDRIFRGAPC